MKDTELKTYLDLAKRAALASGEIIMEVYNLEDYGIEHKSDTSPVTLADKLSHLKIVSILKDTFPILSEEGKDISYDERKEWEYYWCVDPLDGTKEFISQTGDFTVNISLIHINRPVIGVVYAPSLNKCYSASLLQGAFLNDFGKVIALQPSKNNLNLNYPGLKVVCSRHHLNDATSSYIKALVNPELVSMGSSLKFMMLAENKADIYPRFEGTMEWDTAAAQIILEEAGGQVIDVYTGNNLKYNKENLLNPHFIATSIPCEQNLTLSKLNVS